MKTIIVILGHRKIIAWSITSTNACWACTAGPAAIDAGFTLVLDSVRTRRSRRAAAIIILWTSTVDE
jgi:hypothetical protein